MICRYLLVYFGARFLCSTCPTLGIRWRVRTHKYHSKRHVVLLSSVSTSYEVWSLQANGFNSQESAMIFGHSRHNVLHRKQRPLCFSAALGLGFLCAKLTHKCKSTESNNKKLETLADEAIKRQRRQCCSLGRTTHLQQTTATPATLPRNIKHMCLYKTLPKLS